MNTRTYQLTINEVVHHILQMHPEIIKIFNEQLKNSTLRDFKDRFPLEEIFQRFPKEVNIGNRRKYLLTDLNIPHEYIEKLNCELINSTAGLSSDEISSGLFYVYFSSDDISTEELRRIIKFNGKFIPPQLYDKTSYRFTDKLAMNALLKTKDKIHRISHFNYDDPIIHENICEALNLTKNIEGDYVEIGVYKGGSALTALNYLQLQIQNNLLNNQKKAWLFDTFTGFDYEAAENSSDISWNNTHQLLGQEETINYIKETFNDITINYELIPLNICTNELPSSINKIAVANIDVDMYDAVFDALLKVHPLISTGGIIICEDATATPGLYGAYVALQNFLEKICPNQYIKIFKKGQYFLIKK